MKNIFRTLVVLIAANYSIAQTYLDSTQNSATKRIQFADANTLAFGSYGEAHYNQGIVDGQFTNGNMDLHRVIMFMGYKFTNKLSFFSEIEFEHVYEVSVEQAFMNYSYNNLLNFKAGVILVPMGYVNEFHEPTLFNGVERPAVDKYVIPSTWREMGAGMHGILKKVNIKYQLYAMNGFMGYNGAAKINGSGIRSARQKGSEAAFSTPSITGKLAFYGLNGFRLGISGYSGKSVTSMYDGLDRNNAAAIASADSTIVGINMLAINAHYSIGKLRLMAVGNMTKLNNVEAYNTKTGSDAATRIYGAYGEVSYRQPIKSAASYPQVVPFVRYENLDTHAEVDRNVTRDKNNHREILTTGVGLQITPGTMLKADFQWQKTEANPKPTNTFNLGFGYWF